MRITLKRLLAAAEVTPADSVGDAEIAALRIDSRKSVPGTLLICMPGTTRPSESFIPDAEHTGATAALVSTRDGMELARASGMAAALIPNEGELFQDAVWRICDAFHEHPTRNMKVIGVTGTNGKTTTAWILRQLMAELGTRAAYLGTLGFVLPDESRELDNTTPFAVDLYNMISEARHKGIEGLAMEVSSHALAQRRVGGIEFDAALFTNLTQDHLDFHGSMEAYGDAKRRLFTVLPTQTKKRFVAAFNIDDPVGARWALEQDGPTVTFGMRSPESDLRGVPLEVKVDGIRMVFSDRENVEVSLPLGGAYNVENALAAVSGMIALGYPMRESAEALAKVKAVPGRFEAVPNDHGIGILVDYAHTPDALRKLLASVRELNPSRIITVFGCGGDRDRTKRPLMAAAASSLSDLTVVTSDNPRTEDPESILKEVVEGIQGKSVAIVDRPEAVAYAVQIAKPGDVVVIAGKGHEDYQIVGRIKIPMDDRDLARKALELRT